MKWGKIHQKCEVSQALRLRQQHFNLLLKQAFRGVLGLGMRESLQCTFFGSWIKTGIDSNYVRMTMNPRRSAGAKKRWQRKLALVAKHFKRITTSVCVCVLLCCVVFVTQSFCSSSFLVLVLAGTTLKLALCAYLPVSGICYTAFYCSPKQFSFLFFWGGGGDDYSRHWQMLRGTPSMLLLWAILVVLDQALPLNFLDSMF